ncbi:hypothetical protein BpHYR1_015906 [Brachionus plicatilis]|uniref:Uncharacterized protein n=1 Tax=Brachionus plicatilis TaxID=10195 RepID=A0A3M7RTX6_BRAPC|nr:hypothetical protein BpHYR1_015906 [Brachionus plicatilis]
MEQAGVKKIKPKRGLDFVIDHYFDEQKYQLFSFDCYNIVCIIICVIPFRCNNTSFFYQTWFTAKFIFLKTTSNFLFGHSETL